MSRGREAWQQLAASYYAFDGFPELMFVFFFVGPFSEVRLTGSFREALFGSAFFLGSGHHHCIIMIIIIIIIIVSGKKEPKKKKTPNINSGKPSKA